MLAEMLRAKAVQDWPQVLQDDSERPGVRRTRRYFDSLFLTRDFHLLAHIPPRFTGIIAKTFLIQYYFSSRLVTIGVGGKVERERESGNSGSALSPFQRRWL